MVVKVGINGFGRIGRSILQTSLKNPDIQVIAINDPFHDLDYKVDKFTCDSTHGRYKGSISYERNQLLVDGHAIAVFAERDLVTIPWAKHGVDYVVETTDIFITPDEARKDAVISVATPLADAPIFTVGGVNLKNYKPGFQVISNIPCTLKIAGDDHDCDFGKVEEFMTTLYATMATDKPVDVIYPSGKGWCADCGTGTNIIPISTGTTKDVENVVPKLDRRLIGMSFRVPDPGVSVVDLTVRLKMPFSYDEMKAAVKKIPDGEHQGILGYTENELLVSTDSCGDPYSSLFDAKTGISRNTRFDKLNSWHNKNEFGHYSTRTLGLIPQIA